MIVVATDDFEVYHGVVNELRDRGVTFTTQTLDEEMPDATTLLVTGPDDPLPPGTDVDVVRADGENPRRAVEEALAILRGSDGRLVVGIDPGDRPGIAVLSGEAIVAVFQVPADETARVVRREVEGSADPLVRIGDGARLKGARIIDELSDLPVELVDETGTTPYVGRGARGMGDVLAAVNIARLSGQRVDSRTVEPTAGELQSIKRASRERSGGTRTITDALARRVATGELTVEEALEEHRNGE